MFYIQLDEERRIIAYTEAETNPNPNTWLESPWETVPDNFDDWLYDDGALAYAPRNLPPAPMEPAEAVAVMMRGDISDAEAVRLKPYLTEVDTSREYAEGELARHDGHAIRKTATGWREIG